MNTVHPLLFVTCLLLLAGCGRQQPTQPPATTPAPTPADTSGTADSSAASIFAGKVLFKGTPPPRKAIPMNADAFCATAHPSAVLSQSALVNTNGTLQNVFVYVKQGLPKRSFPPPGSPVLLDQVGCIYTPRVVGVQVGQPLDIRNSDATLHNINAAAVANAPFNKGQPVAGLVYRHTFTTREVMIKVICNVHPWMVAYVGVLEHPYFSVTGTNGTFSLSPLPAGTYTIEAWHEKYGTVAQVVTVGEKETKEIDFEFTETSGANP